MYVHFVPALCLLPSSRKPWDTTLVAEKSKPDLKKPILISPDGEYTLPRRRNCTRRGWDSLQQLLTKGLKMKPFFETYLLTWFAKKQFASEAPLIVNHLENYFAKLSNVLA